MYSSRSVDFLPRLDLTGRSFSALLTLSLTFFYIFRVFLDAVDSYLVRAGSTPLAPALLGDRLEFVRNEFWEALLARPFAATPIYYVAYSNCRVYLSKFMVWREFKPVLLKVRMALGLVIPTLLLDYRSNISGYFLVLRLLRTGAKGSFILWIGRIVLGRWILCGFI